MKRNISIIIALFLLFTGCYHFVYKIKIEDTKDLKNTIKQTEELVKKIEVLSTYKDNDYNYPLFWFEDGGIGMIYTPVNYNPNDSIREGRSNPNAQEHIDTCQVIPGLTIDEWDSLKKNLRKLESLGIDDASSAFIRVIDQENWDRYKTEDNLINTIEGNNYSVLFDQARLNNETRFKIISHYDMTNTKLMIGTGAFIMGYVYGELVSEKIKINVNSIMSGRSVDPNNSNDITNIFVHEGKHKSDRLELGNRSFLDKNPAVNQGYEKRAIETQMAHPSWNGTSERHKKKYRVECYSA